MTSRRARAASRRLALWAASMASRWRAASALAFRSLSNRALALSFRSLWSLSSFSRAARSSKSIVDQSIKHLCNIFLHLQATEIDKQNKAPPVINPIQSNQIQPRLCGQSCYMNEFYFIYLYVQVREAAGDLLISWRQRKQRLFSSARSTACRRKNMEAKIERTASQDWAHLPCAHRRPEYWCARILCGAPHGAVASRTVHRMI